MVRWFIEKLLIYYFKKTKFLSFSFPADGTTDIIVTAEAWNKKGKH